MSTRVLVVTGGAPEPAPLYPLGEFDLKIAADSGLDQARHLGIDVDLLVGDLDSVSESSLSDARRQGLPVERHQPMKDETDLELAFAIAVDRGATEVLMVGGAGSRLDHSLANLLVLAGLAQCVERVEALVGGWRVRALDPRTAWEAEGAEGELVSLIAAGGDVTNANSSGLLYPLENATLGWGNSLGVSNRFTGGPASVAIGGGTLLIVRPPEGIHIP